MNRELEKQFKKAQKVSLPDKSRENIRRIVLTHAELNPVRNLESGRLQKQRSKKLRLTRTMPAILGILLLLSGGTAFAAEGALPGDALYPVKVEVNEEVRGWLAFSPEAKARFNSDLAVGRLEEAEELFAEGRLQGEISAKISKRFDARVEEAEARIAELEANGNIEAAAEARARLEAALTAHESVFAEIAEADTFAEVIAAHVNARLGTIMQARTDAEARIDANTDVDREAMANRAHTAAEDAIVGVEAALTRAEGEIDANLYARVRARLETAQEVLAEGEAELQAENYGKAFVLFNRARLTAHGITHFLNAHFRVNIRLGDIREDHEQRVNIRARADDSEDSAEDSGGVDSDGDGSVDTRETDSTDSGVDVETDARIDVDTPAGSADVEVETDVDVGL